MTFTGKVRESVGDWRISVRRAFHDEPSDGYVFCSNPVSGAQVQLSLWRTATGVRAPKLQQCPLPNDVRAAVSRMLAELNTKTIDFTAASDSG